ncbi:GNAT family N-acetyltransferase [Janthinobacterium aquaticum]|uniref:GNAT family N-acetyltransferase n=1 Tax=Janthinobacterium sp. FT58W TaxID=2654254 RepID=UPI001263F5F3|nr:GNAT family N-acetyltransferase [Janthinobacterium sp. FT58W]KAB8042278.1 GNAT family N-acetyltransferase [Janthinobacterium sp. FT58W]
MNLPGVLLSERLALVLASREDGDAVLHYRELNREHLAQWEPQRSASYYTAEAVGQHLLQIEQQHAAGAALHFLLRLHDSADIVGQCSFTNIIRGPFQACHLGFSLGHIWQGKGLMREALKLAIAHMFEVQQLHRIMANYQPANINSEKLLHSLGFECEGLARQYLNINGRWADHVLTSLINTGCIAA